MKTILLSALLIGVATLSFAQKPENQVVAGIPVNYEEAKVGVYDLPALLTTAQNESVSHEDWKNRRLEILRLFEEKQFGKMPEAPAEIRYHIIEEGGLAFGGTALRKQINVFLSDGTQPQVMKLLVYLPAKAKTPSPVLFHISFNDNSITSGDTAIAPGMVWTKEGALVKATTGFDKVDVRKFIKEGFGVALVYYGDIEPDFKQGFKYGIRSKYLKGKNYPESDEWGAISAWAWGLSRAMDYFEKDKDIDAGRVALQGGSRLGKTVLWAGAHDQRFAMVISSCSGEGGAALSRRNYGETVAHITDTSRYFYQFCPNYHQVGKNLARSPIDAHMLIALMAPRPLLLQTGDTDYWSDPKGEFLAALAAEPVYRLFGKSGPQSNQMPEAGDTSLLNTLGYYMHAGGHGTVPSDWDVYMQYLKKFLWKQPK